MKLTRFDLFIIIGFLILSGLGIFFMPKKQGSKVVVKVDGQVLYTKSFSNETIEKKIETTYGYNLLEIGHDYVQVLSASCPNKLDVKQGKISRVGESIICLPNHLLVTIEGEVDENYPDVIVK